MFDWPLPAPTIPTNPQGMPPDWILRFVNAIDDAYFNEAAAAWYFEQMPSFLWKCEP